METIACTLTRDDFTTRRDRWLALGDRALRSRDATSTGLRLTFMQTRAVEAELGKLVELERECCAFADWTVETNGDAVTLRVDGRSPMGVDAVQALFGELRRR